MIENTPKISIPTPEVDPSAAMDCLEQRIDNIDYVIVRLLAERFVITHEIGTLKAKHGLSARASARESEKFAQVCRLSDASGGSSQTASALFRLLMDEVVLRHQQIASRSYRE